MTVTSAEAAEQAPEQLQATSPEPTEQTALLNALQANIEEKRERSYYYAHRPRETSEEPAPPPVHVVLERAVSEPGPTVVTVFNYAWADEGDFVKVYVPLEGVGATCRDEDIKTTFETRVMQLDVHGYKAGQVQRLSIRNLAGDVIPDQCRARKLANKVVLVLKKADGGRKWYHLGATA